MSDFHQIKDSDRFYGGHDEIFLRVEQGGNVNWVPFVQEIANLTVDEAKQWGYVFFGKWFARLGVVLDQRPLLEEKCETDEELQILEDRVPLIEERYNTIFNL